MSQSVKPVRDEGRYGFGRLRQSRQTHLSSAGHGSFIISTARSCLAISVAARSGWHSFWIANPAVALPAPPRGHRPYQLPEPITQGRSWVPAGD